mgnify:CR=1 FL=1
MDLEAEYNAKDIILNLQTKSDNLIFRKNGNTYIDQLILVLDTDFHVNRNTKVIDLKNAKVGINDIKFVTEGTLHPNRDQREVDVNLHLVLEVPTLNTLIDLIPETVFDKTENYEAEGDVSIVADIVGIYKKGVLPAINANFKINNGAIIYKDLPNKIDLIEADIAAYISPEINTGSHFDINNITLNGVGTEINIKGKGENLFDNADLDLSIDGKIDLEALEKSFPFKKSLNLAGSGEIHIASIFNINDIQNQDYGKIQALGTLNMNQIIFHNKSDSLKLILDKVNIHLEQDQNSDLLTEASTKVIGGKVLIQNLEFKDGKKSSGNLDHLDIKFASNSTKDSTKVAVLKATVLIKNGNVNLGDSLLAQLKFVNANISIEPDKLDKKIPKIHSVFQIDSTGIKSKGRFFAILKGAYELTSIRVDNNWPVNGHISFDQLHAYTPTFPLLLKMPQTKITFKPGVISLDHAKLEIGESNIEATGKVYKIVEAFFDDKMFKGELEVNSSLIDFNEFIQAMNQGTQLVEKSSEEILAQDQSSNKTEVVEQPKSFVVPHKLDLSLKSRFKKLKYKTFIIDDVLGVITIKDQKIDLANLQMTTMAAKMTTSGFAGKTP